MPPRSTTWSIKPHTLAKHAIIRKYWQAWLPIMSRWNGRVVYIDGFSGPGEYTGGEIGSPLIAINEALNHTANITSEVLFLFVESDKSRADHLGALLASKSLPSNFKFEVINSEFKYVMSQIFQKLGNDNKILAPTFAFVDPFGYSNTPFDLIAQLMKYRGCEVLITFMYQSINRFVDVESQWPHLDELYGTTEWREVLKAKSPKERLSILHSVYKNQLETNAGAKYVLPFEMEDSGGRTKYFLFFCTNNLKGLSSMKKAMWDVDPTGDFRFAYSSNPNQLQLIDTEPDFEQLRNQVISEFRGKDVSVEMLEEFILVNTPFLDTHYKRQVLKRMEELDKISVVSSPRIRRNSYPRGTVIRFNP